MNDNIAHDNIAHDNTVPDNTVHDNIPEDRSDTIGTRQERVDVTETAAALLRELAAQYGPLMFHQSGGCCDGSSPMCYPVGMFRTGAADILLDTLQVDGIDPVEVYMSKTQFEYWKYTHLTIDVVPGRGSGFSVEAPTGQRFLIRSRMFDDTELERLGLLDTA